MAAITTMSLNYVATDGRSTTHSYKYANKQTEKSKIQALVDATIANKEIFGVPPAVYKSGKFTTSETTTIELDD